MLRAQLFSGDEPAPGSFRPSSLRSSFNGDESEGTARRRLFDGEDWGDDLALLRGSGASPGNGNFAGSGVFSSPSMPETSFEDDPWQLRPAAQ
ncbi:unnamed protein product, partial [Polarella glacialis]